MPFQELSASAVLDQETEKQFVELPSDVPLDGESGRPPHPLVEMGRRVVETIKHPGPSLFETVKPETTLGKAALLPIEGARIAGEVAMAPLAVLPEVVTQPLVPASFVERVAESVSRFPVLSGAVGAVGEVLRPFTSPLALIPPALGFLRRRSVPKVSEPTPITETITPSPPAMRELTPTEVQNIKPFTLEPQVEVAPKVVPTQEVMPDLPRVELPVGPRKAISPEGLTPLEQGTIEAADRAKQVPLPTPQAPPAYHPILDTLERDIKGGQAGYRFPVDKSTWTAKASGMSPDWMAEPSTFPDYFQGKGYTQEGALSAIAKAKAGKPLTMKQGEMLNDLVVGATKQIESDARWAKANQEAKALDMKSRPIEDLPSTPSDTIEPPHLTEGEALFPFGAKQPIGGGSQLFDPDVPNIQPPHLTYMDRLRRFIQQQREKTPAELRTIRRVPESPVISATERHAAGLTEDLQATFKQPWAEKISLIDQETWMRLEHETVKRWEAGGKTPEAYAAAVRQLPQEFQDMLAYRQARLAEEQAARVSLGLEAIPETPGPYFARLTDQKFRDVAHVARQGTGLGAEIQQTVKTFQKPRTYSTMLEGMGQGIVYEDPKAAWAIREWQGVKLRRTAALMKELEGKTLFRTQEEALAASPVHEAVPVEGLPGSQQRWWATSREERNFIVQNLQERPRGTFGAAAHWMNQLFRNPNLFNPVPHFAKNMLYKYGLSGGKFTRVIPDMREYWVKGNPDLMTRFEQVMPFSDDAKMAQQVLREQIDRGGLDKALRVPGLLNRPSSKAIFSYLDPSLRYARWKQYVQQGLGDQEAANHTWVDLIRYGTRSDITDAWKSIPGNFFVPWRYGTVTALTKQLTSSRALKAALFVGAVDYVREAYYRKTGRWMHVPVDYIEGPIAQSIDNPKMIVPLAATTLMFGPGGAMAASSLTDMLNVMRGTEDYHRLVNMLWGVGQAWNATEEMVAFSRDQDPTHLANVFTTAALGMHGALTYEPRRLMKWLPESLPGMEKSRLVKVAEGLQAVKKAKQDASQGLQMLRDRGRHDWLTETEQSRQLKRLTKGLR